MVRGLRPDDPPEILLEALADATRDLVLVGHLPYLPVLRQRLIAADSALPVFPRHGLVLVERAADGWQERLVLSSDL